MRRAGLLKKAMTEVQVAGAGVGDSPTQFFYAPRDFSGWRCARVRGCWTRAGWPDLQQCTPLAGPLAVLLHMCRTSVTMTGRVQPMGMAQREEKFGD